VALLLVLAALFLATRPRPPADELASITRDLAAGREVALLGSYGLPRWSRHSLGSGGLGPDPTRAGACELNTWVHDLVEVVPDPQTESYLYSARVQQSNNRLGEVGLSFLHTQQEGPRGQEHYFATVTFADCGRNAGVVRLNVRRFCEPSYRIKSRGPEKSFTAAFEKWRTLSVRVTAGKVSAYFDGDHVGDLLPSDLATASAFLMSREPATDLPPPTFPRRGGTRPVHLRVVGGLRASYRPPPPLTRSQGEDIMAKSPRSTQRQYGGGTSLEVSIEMPQHGMTAPLAMGQLTVTGWVSDAHANKTVTGWMIRHIQQSGQTQDYLTPMTIQTVSAKDNDWNLAFQNVQAGVRYTLVIRATVQSPFRSGEDQIVIYT
jgi:hypothetical protein